MNRVVPSRDVNRVVIACYPGLQPLDVVGPHEVFAGANRVLAHMERSSAPYELLLCAMVPGAIASESGMTLFAPTTFPSVGEATSIDTLLIPGGYGVYDACADDEFVQVLRELGQRSRRFTTVCSGTFLGAATGLLDGKRVTTHWARAAQLATAYPALDIDADPIFINDGNIWTSAGVTAGIDLALALVQDDHGADVAQSVARHLVMFVRRPGGQSQFAAPVWSKPADTQAVRAAQDLVISNPAADLRVGSLAAAINMSERHFTRLFAAEVGEPPAKFVERIRVEAARRCLEHDGTTVAAVAKQCGFGTAETMRRSFLRRVGVAPDDYRRRFARSAPSPLPSQPSQQPSSQPSTQH